MNHVLKRNLIASRIAAAVHLREVEKISRKAQRMAGEEDWVRDYIWNGGSVRFVLRMVELEKKNKYKEAGKEIIKYASKKGVKL